MNQPLYHFVLDCSITMTWCFEDEGSDYTDEILEKLKFSKAVVPTIWTLEVANVLLSAKRNNRLTEMQAASFIDTILELPIIVDHSTTSKALHSIYILASEHNLSIYDATYLELAIREKIPLLTLDKDLIRAAKKLQVSLECNKIGILS